jgi:2-C-methyl-D-erythritol 4-phosphate cytidylyltransferase
LCTIAGRTLVERAVARFDAHPGVRDVIVVAPPTHLAQVAELVPRVRVVAGGAERTDSVCRGLDATAADVDAVLVHDVARPFVPSEVISRVVAALAAGAVGVIPGVAVTDTIKQVEAGQVNATVARGSLRAVQTPQGFRRDVLLAAYAHARSTGSLAAVTDDASVLEAAGHPVAVVDGDQHALKITTPWDLRVAELLAAEIDRGDLRSATKGSEPR